MKIKLHTLRFVDCLSGQMAISDGEVEVETEAILDLRFASYTGGSIIELGNSAVMVDENPNYIGLLAGFIEGKQYATGSRTGSREYYHDKRVGLI